MYRLIRDFCGYTWHHNAYVTKARIAYRFTRGSRPVATRSVRAVSRRMSAGASLMVLTSSTRSIAAQPGGQG
jgi:hypothetical protein